MSVKNYPFRVIGSAMLILTMSALTFADTIRLKDGSIIKGKITSFGGGEFTVAIGQGARRREMRFAVDEIESIVFDEVPRRSVVTASDRIVDDSPPTRADNSTRIASNQPVYTPPASSTQKTTTSVPKSNTTVPRTTTSVPKTSSPRQTNPAVKTTDPTIRTTEPTGRPTDSTATNTAKKPAPVKPSPIGSKPVQLAVKVLADNTANGWTNSGWVVKKGQKIRISGTGEVSIGRGKTATPSGLYDLKDDTKLLKSVPTAALIAVIGDDNNDFIYIGAEREFTAERDGSLFLGLNEGNLDDNAGSYDVKIEILPAGAE